MKLKNIFIHWLCRKKKETQQLCRKRFLVVSTTGLGDSLWASPAIEALRARYPSAYIALLTSPIGKEVFAYSPHLNEIFSFTKPPIFSAVRFFFFLKKRNIDTVFFFHASQRIVFLLCFLLRAREYIGTKGQNKGLDHLFTHIIEPAPIYRNNLKNRVLAPSALPQNFDAHSRLALRQWSLAPHQNSEELPCQIPDSSGCFGIHEIERRLKIVEVVGAQPSTPSLLKIFLSEEDDKKALQWIEQQNLKGRLLIAIHPGAKDKFKQWPLEHFVCLGKQLQEKTGATLLITGTPEENLLTTSIAEKIPGALAVHNLPLRTFAALLKQCRLMISNDTGPMHVSFAIKTPTIALFTPTDPLLCGPYHAMHAYVIQKPPTCTPCLRKQCKEPFCLLQISIKEVLDASLKVIDTVIQQ